MRTRGKHTQKNFDRTLAHVIMTIKSFALKSAHFVADGSCILVKECDEGFEDI